MESKQIIIDTSISSKFKLYLESKPISLSKLSADLDTSKSHLSRVLNGERILSEPLRQKMNAYFETDY